jgi:hypothetical protein
MIIYKTTNLINGKIYIGKDERNKRTYLGSGILLKKAIAKYGIDNFKKEILEECNDKDILCEREKFWIEQLNARDPEIGYNIAEGGCGGMTYTQEMIDNLSNKMKGRKLTPETISKMLETKSKKQYVKKSYTPEEIEVYRQKTTDLWKTDEYRNKVINGLKNCENNYSEEFLEYQTHKKCLHKEDTGQKISEALRSRTPEQKLIQYEKFLLSRCNKLLTEEEKEKKLNEYRYGKPRKIKRGEEGYVPSFSNKKHKPESINKMKETYSKRTIEDKINVYIKFHISRLGYHPSEEKINNKMEEYKNLKGGTQNKC